MLPAVFPRSIYLSSPTFPVPPQQYGKIISLRFCVRAYLAPQGGTRRVVSSASHPARPHAEKHSARRTYAHCQLQALTASAFNQLEPSNAGVRLYGDTCPALPSSLLQIYSRAVWLERSSCRMTKPELQQKRCPRCSRQALHVRGPGARSFGTPSATLVNSLGHAVT